MFLGRSRKKGQAVLDLRISGSGGERLCLE
jgi:hypothetical protein